MSIFQNSPLTRENPPKKLSFYKALTNQNQNVQVLLSAIAIATVFFAVVVFMVITNTFFNLGNGDLLDKESLLATDFLIMLFGVITSFMFLFSFLNKERSLAIKEQLRYYELGQVRPLNTEQRQALRLNLVNMYYSGDWCETLESYPCTIGLGGKAFKPRTFDVIDEKFPQQQLNEDWGILNTKQYNMMVEKIFKGLHSKLFAYDIQSEVAESMVEQLSGLIKKEEEYVWHCNESLNHKPKKLIWGFDLWRIIPMSRNAFMAGYINEEVAWTNILKASKCIYYLFDNHEDFYTNYRLGHAFWSNDFNATTDRLNKWNFFNENCDWPIRNLAWDQPASIEDIMPEEMKTNFSAYISEVSQERTTNPIGFNLDKGE